MNETEASRTAEKLWQKCKKAHSIYHRAREKGIAEVDKSLEHLSVASDEAITAYKEASAGLMRRRMLMPYGEWI